MPFPNGASIGVIALLLLLAGGLAWALSRRAHAASGLPDGRLVSADTSRWLPTDRPLFSNVHHLSGKPDYLVRHQRELIPVELKSARAPEDGPREGHVLQLAAYCLLVAETEGRRPTHGIIKYADAAFEIDYTPALERSLLSTLRAMRRAMRQDKVRARVKRSHTEAARCASCGYRHACDEQLA